MSDESEDEPDRGNSENQTNEERDDGKSENRTNDDRRRGFDLRAGLRPLSDLLGSLVEVSVNDAPPPSESTVEWTNVDERDAGQRRDEAEPERKRTKRVRKSTSQECLIDTRRTGDELEVTADLPGASKEDVSVGLHPGTNELVIGRDGSTVGRVDLPWESPEATKVWFNNGVLEVRLRPERAD